MKRIGVGVDLISIPRIQKFLKDHSKSRILRLLSEPERRRFSKRNISARTLAKIFSAKEAFFKTLGESWMGLEGFSSMETKFFSSNQFEIKVVSGPLASKGDRAARGCFFSVGKLLGAQVMRWED